ncbi:MAG: hypothetical protein IJ326_12960 [Lachnospiraceae bacterium]|nr:hypothetical protein [Lachnospiraceae bacterium]
MRRRNKSNRKNYIKMTALTLAMVTAMSVVKPCEVLAASNSSYIGLGNRLAYTSINGSQKSISATTSYTSSTGVVNVRVQGWRCRTDNPAIISSEDQCYREGTAPGGASASIAIYNNDWKYYYGQSTHGAKKMSQIMELIH